VFPASLPGDPRLFSLDLAAEKRRVALKTRRPDLQGCVWAETRSLFRVSTLRIAKD
jgi:hypothetical protein